MAKTEKKESLRAGSTSSGSATTEPTKRDQAIKELGRKLIAELEDRDLTAKWMASYLAEQMTASQEDASLNQETSDLILKLWEKRRHYPGRNIMERYEKALSAMELHLSTGTPVFQVRPSFEQQDGFYSNKISLARELKHHTEGLAAVLIKSAIKELDLDKDQLGKLADIGDPDEETRFMTVLKIVSHEKGNNKSQTDPYSEIRAAITDLRLTLDKLEAGLDPEAEEPKRVI